jgi:hypothetical protein
MRYHFTYQTKCLINDKTYVGVHSTSNLNDSYIGSGIALKKAIAKYGRRNFVCTVLSFFNTSKEAYEEEAFIVDEEWVKKGDNYNLNVGGFGNPTLHCNGLWTGKKHTMETKVKQRKAKLGKKNSMYGKVGSFKDIKSHKHPNAKKVINTITGKIYDCAKYAAKEEGIPYSTLKNRLNGSSKTKTHLRYAN